MAAPVPWGGLGGGRGEGRQGQGQGGARPSTNTGVRKRGEIPVLAYFFLTQEVTDAFSGGRGGGERLKQIHQFW